MPSDFNPSGGASSVADRSDAEPRTISGRPVKTVYGPEDLANFDPNSDLGEPGEFPFTRGPHREMYRKRGWTMRQFAGFGTPAQTNERFHYLLGQGQVGLSTAFDLPTLMGRDSDDPLSRGEVGRCGVAIDTLADFETLYRGIDLGEISVSMTINAPAAVLLAFYVALADKLGVPRDRLRGTCQNDILKEYHAQNEFVYPPRPSLKLVVDTIQFSAEQLPKYNPVSISGYHIREAGSTAAQELASRWPMPSPTSRPASSAAWTLTASRRGTASSSTATSISSRRSPSSALPGGSTRGGCATSTARPTRVR